MEQFDPLNLKVETEASYDKRSQALTIKTTLWYGDVYLSSSEVDISYEVRALISDNASRENW